MSALRRRDRDGRADQPRSTSISMSAPLSTRRRSRAYGDWSMGFVHSPDLESEGRALLRQDATSSNALQVMNRPRQDTVMGAL